VGLAVSGKVKQRINPTRRSYAFQNPDAGQATKNSDVSSHKLWHLFNLCACHRADGLFADGDSAPTFNPGDELGQVLPISIMRWLKSQ
jgi:hypothetical protein